MIDAQNRNQDAFALLVTHTERSVLNRLRRYGFESHDAEDIAAATYVECWVKLPLLRDPARFEGWLMALLHGFACEASRRRATDQRRVAFVTDDALDEQLAPDAPAHDDGFVRDIVSVLNDEDRELLEEKYLHRVTLREIASRSGLKIYHVAHRLRRIKQQLRVRWQVTSKPELGGARGALAGVDSD